MAAHLVRLLYEANQHHDVRSIERRNREIEEGRATGKILRIREIRPEGAGIDTLEFKERALRAGLVAGYAAALKALGKMKSGPEKEIA